MRAGVGGAVDTWLYVFCLVRDAMRLQHDSPLQDAFIFLAPMDDRRQDDEDDGRKYAGGSRIGPAHGTRP